MDQQAAQQARVSADLNALAHELAYSCARSDIEVICRPHLWEPGRQPWWDTEALTDEDSGSAECLARALFYLEALGLIVRHPEQLAWVRVLDAAPDVALPIHHISPIDYVDAESRN